VLEHLNRAFSDNDLGTWESADGGYFISFDTRPGLAKEVVRLAGEAGVKLTPAGATYPYGKDPKDTNIRIAPTVPTVPQVDTAMKVFITCVKLASVRQQLGNKN
jgi:DNA-binding transcriptional MocR family regulator